MRDITPQRPEEPGSPSAELQDTVRGWDVTGPAAPSPESPPRGPVSPPPAPGAPARLSRSRRPRGLALIAGGVVGVALLTGVVPAVFGGHADPVPVERAASRIELVGDSEGVDLLPVGGDRATVSVPTLFGAPRAETEATWQGDTLRLELSCRGIGGCGREIRVGVPSGIPVSVRLTSGSFDARDLDAALNVTATSGSVDLRDIRGDVSVETTSGSVELSDHTGAARVRSTSGSVRTESSGGDVTVETTTGAVDVRAGAAGQVSAKSNTGSIDARVDSGLRWLWAESGSGSVDVVVPKGTYDVSGRDGSGSRDVDVRNGRDGVPLHVESRSGSVEVDES